MAIFIKPGQDSISLLQQKCIIEMSARFNAAAAVKMTNECNCCILCKSRIQKLEKMMNSLFCYISDFLPEEFQQKQVEQPSLPAQNSKISSFSVRNKPQITEDDKNYHRLAKQLIMVNNDYKIKSKAIDQAQERKPKTRKEFTDEEKKELVKNVQDAYRNGFKIKDACEQLGVRERTYRRWRKAIQERAQLSSYGVD